MRVAPSASLLELLVAGELDVVVCVEPPEPEPGIEAEALVEEHLSVYGPPGTAIGAPSTWGPWVLFPAGSHTRSVVVDALRRVSEAHGATITQVALSWLIHRNGDTVVAIPGLNVAYLSMNNMRAPFDDARVRRALGHAFNRQAFLDRVFFGLPMPSFIRSQFIASARPSG